MGFTGKEEAETFVEVGGRECFDLGWGEALDVFFSEEVFAVGEDGGAEFCFGGLEVMGVLVVEVDLVVTF